MKKEYRSLIDKWNEDLWRTLNAHFHITLKPSPETSYITNYSPEGITIFIDNTNMDPAPFTHELLHLYLKYKEVSILNDFTERTQNDNELLYLFSQTEINQISNSLEHFKMLPMFLTRNFKREPFITDYQIP